MIGPILDDVFSTYNIKKDFQIFIYVFFLVDIFKVNKHIYRFWLDFPIFYSIKSNVGKLSDGLQIYLFLYPREGLFRFICFNEKIQYLFNKSKMKFQTICHFTNNIGNIGMWVYNYTAETDVSKIC